MLTTLRQISAARLRIRSPLPTKSARGYSNSTRPRDNIALPWVWPSDVTSSNVVHEQLKIGKTGSFAGKCANATKLFIVECMVCYFFASLSRSESLDCIASKMTPVVVSSVVDAINNKNKAALTKMMTPAMASMYTSALARMGENGYDIKIDIKSLDNVKVGGASLKIGHPKSFNTVVPFESRCRTFSYFGTGPHIITGEKILFSNGMHVFSKLLYPFEILTDPVMLEFWSTAQARIAITLSQRGKVVDQDEGYMPIVVSMASPTYPQISEAPTIFTDGNVESDISDHKIPFEWRVSDLFLKITNKEIRAIDRVRVL